MIDFTTTAMVRPGIFNRTARSFDRRLNNLDLSECALYLNIDPLPKGDPKKVISIAEQYFGRVVSRVAKQPQFARAQQWCWTSTTADYVFNLQDDWVLSKDIDFLRLLHEFQEARRRNQKVVQARLSYFSNMRKSRLFLSPSLMWGEACREFAEKMDIDINPEWQIKRNGFRAIVYPGRNNSVVKDIGRAWSSKQRFKRPPSSMGKHFVKWTKR